MIKYHVEIALYQPVNSADPIEPHVMVRIDNKQKLQQAEKAIIAKELLRLVDELLPKN